MASTITVDQDDTFALQLLMDSARKTKYGSDEVATNAAGVPQWVCTVAVTFRTAPGERPSSDTLTVTITRQGDPFHGLAPGTPVRFERLRAGLSAPEHGAEGRIRGGKLWYQADGIAAANGTRPAKSDG